MGKITDLNETAFSVKDTLEYFAFAANELLKKDYDKEGYEKITRCLENYEKTRGKTWETRNKIIVSDRYPDLKVPILQVIKTIRRLKSKAWNKRNTNQWIVQEATLHGHGISSKICIEIGIDPDGFNTGEL